MSELFSLAQAFALFGLVVLVATLVLGEMFERAIQRDLEEHEGFEQARGRREGTTNGRQ